MHPRAAVTCLALASACGRVGFDARTSSQDAALAAYACPVGADVSTEVTISGTTSRPTDFQGGTLAVPGVAVEIDGLAAGNELGLVTSDASTAAYSIPIPTGGEPTLIEVTTQRTGYIAVHDFLEAPITGDVARTAQITVGGALDSVYSSGSVTRDPAASTLSFQIFDCAGAVVEGVEVAIDPAPGRIEYATPSNGFDAGHTTAPWGYVVAFNAAPGPTTITATKAGVTFYPRQVDVVAGDHETMTTIHAVP